ncbi:MAG TPA: DUF4407 domain-containing protein [Saprospiraceae bacterium]|nr:DUF4407 domain-containing protein [Saprospiraceae bacterium]
MFRICSILIGEDPNYTANYDPASKRKVILYAHCLMIPVIIWFINGFLLVHQVLDGNLWLAILTAIIASFIIFLIERSILLSDGKILISALRFTMAISIAFLGAICLDEVIFKNDIDNHIIMYQQEYADSVKQKFYSEFENEISIQQKSVDIKNSLWIEALNDAKGEADGTKGSGSIGVKEIAIMKIDIAKNMQSEYEKSQVQLEKLIEERDHMLSIELEKFNSNGLLLRIKAMFELIFENVWMLITFICFSILFFSMEMLVVIVKMVSKESTAEKLEAARNKYTELRIERHLENAKKHHNPMNFDPHLEKAKIFVNQVHTPVLT